MNPEIFKSYLMGGFECSTHLERGGKRVDVIAATRHDDFAAEDYRRLLDTGIRTARDGARWHLIETSPYHYDWSSVINQIRAARETGMQIIWDLFHYGYPNDLDVFSPEFVERFAAFAENFVKFLVVETDEKPYICLVNEISFFAWAAGQVGFFYPFKNGRGDELKRNLVRAAIAAAARIKRIAPEAFLIQTDPVVKILPRQPRDKKAAADYHEAQFHALDCLLGRSEPELGGAGDLIDMIGVNYYSNNQWRHPGGARIFPGDAEYTPFSEILKDFYARFRKPVFVAETGIEDEARPEWFRYVCGEVEIARRAGVPVHGICLYPIVNHPGWGDDRHCHNGLWDYPNDAGEREIYQPLAAEIERQKFLIGQPIEPQKNNLAKSSSA